MQSGNAIKKLQKSGISFKTQKQTIWWIFRKISFFQHHFYQNLFLSPCNFKKFLKIKSGKPQFCKLKSGIRHFWHDWSLFHFFFAQLIEACDASLINYVIGFKIINFETELLRVNFWIKCWHQKSGIRDKSRIWARFHFFIWRISQDVSCFG